MLWVILSLSFLGVALGHTYHLGDCPAVEPMSGFEMSKFLGVWYAVQKTSTGSRCLTYNFTTAGEPGEYRIEQVSEHPVLGVASVDNKYHYTGELKASDIPAKMTVNFPLSIAGKSSYIVFMTDYDTYAGIYTCQKLPASHRRSATILSRKKTLDKPVIEKIRSRLSLFGISPFDLSLIDQKKCLGHNEEATVDFGLDPETLSAKNLGGYVKTAGDAIGEGVEFAAEKLGKAYKKISETQDLA